MLSCLVAAIIIAVGLNGVAMTASHAGQATHCANAIGATMDDVRADHAHHHAHDHDGDIAQHASSEQDRDTCMMHACPALSADTIELGELADSYLTTLSWPERPLLMRELANGLKRPPRS